MLLYLTRKYFQRDGVKGDIIPSFPAKKCIKTSLDQTPKKTLHRIEIQWPMRMTLCLTRKYFQRDGVKEDIIPSLFSQ